MDRNATWRRYLHFWRHRPERDVDEELRGVCRRLEPRDLIVPSRYRRL